MTDSKTIEWVKEDLRVDVEPLARTIVLVCQYTWPKDREKSVEKATRLINSFLDGRPAYERGRKEGIEEAAKVAAQFIDGRLYKPKMPACSYHSAELATAIRQLLEVKG